MSDKWYLILSAVIYLSASIVTFISVLKINAAVSAINKMLELFYERADSILARMRSTQKQYGENTDKTTDLITSLGDIRKTIITIGNFRSQLSDLSSSISRIKRPEVIKPSENKIQQQIKPPNSPKLPSIQDNKK
jgi:hypothetical protein